MEENEKSGLLGKAMPVVEPQDLGTYYRAAANMAALAGTAVMPPLRAGEPPCDTRRTGRLFKE
jgi:hypothetical protein